MLRKRNDSIKDGCGDSGTEGQTYTKDHAFNDMDFGYPGQRSKESSYAGAYTSNQSGLTRSDNYEGSNSSRHGGSVSRDILDDVETNQNPGGEFDSTGPITAGVSRSQES